MGAIIVYKNGKLKNGSYYVWNLMRALGLNRTRKVPEVVVCSPEDKTYLVYEPTSKELDIATRQGADAVKAYFAKVYENNPQAIELIKPLEEAFVTKARLYEGGGPSYETPCEGIGLRRGYWK